MPRSKRPQRPDARNHTRRTELLAQATQPFEPPDHLDFADPEERAYYCRLLKYRAPDDWAAADFDRLKEASGVWWDIRVNEDIAMNEDYLLHDDNGKPFINPRFTLIDRFRARHDAILRSMSIARPSLDPRTIAKRRRDAAAAAEAVTSTHPLLAQPVAAPRPNVVPFKAPGRKPCKPRG